MIAPLFVNRERSIKAVDQSLAENRMIMLVAQKNPAIDDPKAADLHDFGTVSVIMRMLKLPDGRVRILVQGFSRAKVEYFDETQPYLVAKVRPKAEVETVADSVELEALIRNVKSAVEKAVTLGKNLSQDLVAIITSINDPGRLADLVASNLDLKVDKAQEILELVDPVERLRQVHNLITKELEVLEVQNDITSQARGEIDRSQREFYLRQQMKAIQQELGEGNELQEEIAQYRRKIRKAKMPGGSRRRSRTPGQPPGAHASGCRGNRHDPKLSRLDGVAAVVQGDERQSGSEEGRRDPERGSLRAGERSRNASSSILRSAS